MRILAITHIFPHAANSYNGIFAARQFSALTRSGAECVVFFAGIKIPKVFGYVIKKWKDRDVKSKPVDFDGLEVIQVPYVRLERGCWSCRWEGLALFQAMKKKAREMHRMQPFDVIYGRGLFPCADAAAFLSKYLNIPAVGAAIGSDVNIVPHYSPSLYRHYNKLLARLNGVVANGQGLADTISPIIQKACPVLEGVVDLDVFQPALDKATIKKNLHFSSKGPVLLFVGNLAKEKGVYDLLEAFAVARSAEPALQLVLCGNGNERSGMEKRIHELNLVGCVEMIGTVVPRDMHLWMQACDISILPSYYEGMPNAVMEAMACGLPVIVSAVGGLPGALSDSKGAILIEPGNIEQLTKAIITVAGDAHLRERMGIHARATAIQKFGAQMNAQKLIDYFESIIANYTRHS